MYLILFDVDGTLVDSHAYDSPSYLEAMTEILAVDEIRKEWISFKHATDTYITGKIFENALGRPPTAAEYDQVLRLFLSKLERTHRDEPQLFKAWPGASGMLSRLAAKTPAVAVAIATGGWYEAARFKLDKSGIAVKDIPLASSTDAAVRTEIMTVAHDRARAHYGVHAFDRVVYVGDAPWDLEAARELGYLFIGVGRNTRELVAAGSEYVTEDFRGPLFEDLLATLLPGLPQVGQ